MHTMQAQLSKIVKTALEEDIGSGDVTTESTVAEEQILEGKFIAKADGIIAGLQIAALVFNLLDKDVKLEPKIADGKPVGKGDVIAAISGPGRAILSGERVALNFLQRMSGIAGVTRKYVDSVRGTNAVILDTRKTAPGLRLMDKMAVAIGGGQNHRFGLFDMVLIKDNHITAAGSIRKAVEQVRSKLHKQLQIEVEVKNNAELEEALSLNADRILLDNMTIGQISEAVKITDNKIPLEASGNISLRNVRAYAGTGVDYISIGRLTHSVEALDISLLINW